MKYFIIISSTIIVILASFSCRKKGHEARYGPFYVENDTTVFFNGNMKNNIDKKFDKLILNYPNIKLINFGVCPGSNDDEAMIKAATLLISKNINTHLSSTSIIESGAVDFYLAGQKRTRELGSKIGVHAWSDGKNVATDYPEGHSEHQIYIDYYMLCGYSEVEAKNIYNFIIGAATYDEIHFMTEEEIDEHNLVRL